MIRAAVLLRVVNIHLELLVTQGRVGLCVSVLEDAFHDVRCRGFRGAVLDLGSLTRGVAVATGVADWSTFSRSPTEKKVTLAACRLALSARLSGEYATSVASWKVPSTPDAIIPPYKKMRMNVRVLGVSALGTTIAVKMRERACKIEIATIGAAVSTPPSLMSLQLRGRSCHVGSVAGEGVCVTVLHTL